MNRILGFCSGLAIVFSLSAFNAGAVEVSGSDANPSDNIVEGDGVSGTITNTVEGKKLVNIAAGEGSEAALASVVVENSDITGRIDNQANVAELMNIASGVNADANLCSIKIENSFTDSTIVNHVQGSCAKNIALGDDSCANYGSVVLKNQDSGSGNLPTKIINDVTVGGAGNDCNVAENGQISNKNSVVFK